MAEFQIDDLVRALRECAGVDESVDLSGDILDSSFEELGYDSLALFNTVSWIERERGRDLGDDVVTEARTPRMLLALINKD
ncbi:actinorhodin polyketide synthase acyl carrier protein [Longispora fulva]|uniref:Act minimal PKS acyl carrier protein n=1 Tax=Longispora fulva TaxID=619741 RepID=A0A8J7KDN2_9ACTN|nr:acyl carrier protein [Longispora fulva]MBG6134205.1 act minimal PKS acyl carrier protein [Longispora fulva]GIG63097.1 actinorhodin polyketide synthase acyl carrier protein [Longispora fulva]